MERGNGRVVTHPAPAPSAPPPRPPAPPGWVRRGLLAGLAASAVLQAALLVPRFALGVPHPAELLSDWLTLLMPFGFFDAALALLGHAAKPLLFLGALAA